MRRHLILAVLSAVAITGCARAEFVSSEGGVHTLRIDHIDEIPITSPADMSMAMMRRASELCPAGWEKISETAVPRETPNPLLYPIVALEWKVRCL